MIIIRIIDDSAGTHLDHVHQYAIATTIISASLYTSDILMIRIIVICIVD